MTKMKTVAAIGPSTRVKVRGGTRVKILPTRLEQLKQHLDEKIETRDMNGPYPEENWQALAGVVDNLFIFTMNPNNMFTGLGEPSGYGNHPVNGDPIGLIIDASFAKNLDLEVAVRADPEGYYGAAKFRSGVGDRRPIFKDGAIFFDNVDDYMKAINVPFSDDMELFATVTIPEGTNGSLWGSSGFGQAAPFIENSDSDSFSNPQAIRYEINGVEVESAGGAYLRSVENRVVVKIRFDMSNETVWPDLMVGGKTRLEWFLGLKIHGFAIHNRAVSGRALTIPERRVLFKMLKA